MPKVASVRDIDVSGKRVLVRVDFNVPLKDGAVADDARIRAALPTIALLKEKGAASITLLTHLGRPHGAQKELSTEVLKAKLAELGIEGVELHENLRFDEREEKNDEGWAHELASLGDVYVNEAFSNSHRRHASMVGIPKFLPGCIGLRFEEEIMRLTEALTPAHPAVALIGGAKFETKIPLLEKLITQYDKIYLGGALGNDLLKVRGLPVGASLVADVMAPDTLAEDQRIEVPLDAALEANEGEGRTSYVADTHMHEKIMDIGPQTAEKWAEELVRASFVLWNGPLGVYEKGYVEGTDTLAKALGNSKARAVVGGGETLAALRKFVFDKDRVFISTGGGAMLEFLATGTLPALDALRK